MQKTILFIVGIVFFIVLIGIGLYYMENYSGIYYTQIDNIKVEKLNTSDNMKYEYTLECYNQDGKSKIFKFKTSRELREDAYLSLTIKITGVNKWEEVMYDELPDKVKEKYN